VERIKAYGLCFGASCYALMCRLSFLKRQLIIDMQFSPAMRMPAVKAGSVWGVLSESALAVYLVKVAGSL